MTPWDTTVFPTRFASLMLFRDNIPVAAAGPTADREMHFVTNTPPNTLGPVCGGGVLGGLGGLPGWDPRYPNVYTKMTPSLHWSF